jgi:inner membrane protein
MISSSPTPSAFEQIRNSQFTKLFIVGFLVLLLQIPTLMMYGLIQERQNIRQQAITEVTGKWGNAQIVAGPRLMVPYIKRITKDGKATALTQKATFLPDQLNITGVMDSQTRHRGIFEIPVYTSKLDIQGKFDRPDLSTWGVKDEDILWDRSELIVQVADTRAITNQVTVNWNNANIPLDPGLGKLHNPANSLNPNPDNGALSRDAYGSGKTIQVNGSLSANTGIHAVLRGRMEGKTFNFRLPLEIRGSEQLAFVPMGKFTKVALTSNWNNPSFQGGWLPEKPKVTKDGFEATWDVSFLGRNFPQQWNVDAPVNEQTIFDSRFGVDLISPTDNYRLAERSIKYNFLFLVLTFAVLWLFEVVAKLRVHPLQYLMVGVAMCLFYLLQLALSEHLGFHHAYALASFAVVVMITGYTMSVLRAKRRGGIVGVMQVSLYSYLYVVLASQDYSLLLGSIGLFVFLGVVMFLTRRVDWFNSSGPRRSDSLMGETPMLETPGLNPDRDRD